MGTRSFIAVKLPKGYKAIYCHWDGYPEGVGATLNEHYTDKKKILQLIKLGDISSLKPDIGSKHDFDEQIKTGKDSHPTWTMAYGRDRGEKGVGAKSYATLDALRKGASNMGTEYLYIFENGKWRYEEVKWN